jgi:hypothetical protein
MSQQNIDFGTFPDDPSADAIRTAFQKVQDNFDDVYASTANAAVLSVNRTAGRGISVNSPTGNVIVEANVASLSISSVTLRVGFNGKPILLWSGISDKILTNSSHICQMGAFALNT